MDKLTPLQKQLIVEHIRALDPQGELVTLTLNAIYTGGSIAYNNNSGLTLNEKISRLTDEEYVRAYLVVRLVKELRYPVENLELEKTYTIGRPSPTKAQIDVKVWDKRRGKPQTFMLIEAKRPDEFETYTTLIEDQLFATGNQEYASGIRHAAWYSLEFHGDTFRDKCIVIDFRKFHEHRAWVEAGELGHNLDLPVEYGTVRKQRYVKGESPLRTDVTRAELEALRRDFHNVLWGGAKMGDTDVFNNLLKMFIVKIYDEQTTDDGKPYRFQIELKNGEPESSAEVVAKIHRRYQDALSRYFGYSEESVKAAALNENRFPPNKVTYVVERLEGISLVENTYEDDVLGAFFEAIVRTGFKQEKGQFFTHTNIVRFILYALELDTWAIDLINGKTPTLPYIIDASCGSGTFLLEAMKLITQSVLHTNKSLLRKSNVVRNYVDEFFLPDSKNKNVHNRWARYFIYGIDDNEDLAAATKVNMILHGDGNANILKADGLADFGKYPLSRLQVSQVRPNAPYKFAVNGQFDCVVSNPPFSLKEESRTLAEYGTRFAYAEQKNSENLFIERWYQLLKEGGRLGVVLPDSVFDTNENLYIRLFLYRYFWIRAVVSLPQVTFQPHTPTKTSLLFAVKKTRAEVEAWDAAWRKATNDYGKLRKSPVVEFVRRNDRLRNALIDMAKRLDVEWYPSHNLLAPDTLPDSVREQFIAACADNPKSKARLNDTLKEVAEFVAQDTLKAWSEGERTEARATLTRLLRDRLPPNAHTLTLPQFLEAAYDDTLQAAELNYTEDPQGQSYCNAWWAFAEVTSQKPFDYEIFFAEAEQVGYKRSTRHPEGMPRPNDLLQTDADGNVVIDTQNPKTILDALRSKRLFFSNAVTLAEADGLRIYHRHFSHVTAGFDLQFSARFLHPKFELLEQQQLRSRPILKLKMLCARPIVRGTQPIYEDSNIRAVKTANLKNGHLDWTDAQTVGEDFYEANQRRAGVTKSDVLMASTGTGSLGKVDYYDDDTPALADGHVAIMRVNSQFNPRLLAYVLRSRIAQWQIEQLLSGATNQIEIYPEQLASLRLPVLNHDQQKTLINRVTEIESAITAARARLRQPADIINEIVCRAFGYPLTEHREREREHQYTRRLSDFRAAYTLRDSAKFHHPDYELTDNFFAHVRYKRVKAYLARPAVLGVQISPTEFDEEGEHYYLTPAVIKTNALDEDALRPITVTFYQANHRRVALHRNDVILGASGEGMGKVALYNSDLPSIISQFIMRLRFNDAMNPSFAWYFFRSLMFQAQIEREKRGLSLPNIFPSQVEQMLVVDCTRTEQDALADNITTELDALQRERDTIEARRKEIDALIEAALQPAESD